jgi:hypothetical protein
LAWNLIYIALSLKNKRDMEYYTTTTIETHTIMLIVGLAIMLLGGYAVTLFAKDESKMIKWVVGVVSVGGILTFGSVLAMAFGF